MLSRLLTGVSLALVTSVGAGWAAETGMHRLIGNVDIYYGVMPARLAGEAASVRWAGTHSAASSSAHSYHLNITLIDHDTGKHISHARVVATVGEFGLTGKRKKLESMEINNTVSYGNYFTMRGEGPHHIVVRAVLPGRPEPVEASFSHRLR